MGFLKPKIIMPPPLPEPEPLPVAPTMEDPEVAEAGEAAVAAVKEKTGRKKTILTSPQGILEEEESYKPSLLS